MTSFFSRAVTGNIAMESEATGKLGFERELDWYARITDWEQLKKAASWEAHSQWQIPVAKHEGNAGSGSIRMRAIWPGGSFNSFFDLKDPCYVQAIKLKGNGGKYEVESERTADEFKVFQYLCDYGMVKDRYKFPVPGTDRCWEIDCFLRPEAELARRKGLAFDGPYYHEWVKIDYEFKQEGDPIPPLPITVENLIDRMGKDRTEEDSKILDLCYSQLFRTPNPHLG